MSDGGLEHQWASARSTTRSAGAWPIEDDDVRAALLAAYADGSWGRYHGPNSERLVAALADFHNVPHVTLCSSGTIAVELALRGVKVGAGDEVILAAYDFPGNFRAVEAIGARPVLVDIDPATWCLDAAELDTAVGERTRAIIVSHLHGGLAQIERVARFARQHGLAVVEDACQSPGAWIGGRRSGAWGDAGVLSFGGSKLLTAGRGGAVLTRQREVHQRIKVFADRGNDAFPLSELQAAVLVPQLSKLDERNERRRENVARLSAQLADLDELGPVRIPAPPDAASYYKLAWRIEPPEGSSRRDELIAAFRREGVPIDSGFRGFADRSDRRCRRVGALDHARSAARDTVLLHHPVLLSPPEAIDRLADRMRRALERGARRGDLS
jgi:dTDP-4-amino-4,6-dideoxygalactose transaminase